jgi:hypothetical protein
MRNAKTPVMLISFLLVLVLASVSSAICTFEPDSLRFSSSVVEVPNHLSFTITNTGTQPVSEVITIGGISQWYFHFDSGQSTYGYNLAPGQSETVGVYVQVSYGGPLYAHFDLGAVAAGCPTNLIYAHAYGMWPADPGVADCGTSPWGFLEFPPTVVGESSVDDLWVDNAGGELPQQQAGTMMGVMPQVCGDFFIPWGAPFAVTTHQVWDVYFQPTTPGWQSCELELPEQCVANAPLILRGLGLGLGTFSDVSVSEIDFGIKPVGSVGYGSFTILNIGTEILYVDIPATCGPFVVTSRVGPRNLGSAAEMYVTVEYHPETSGVHECELDFGPDTSPVMLNGVALEDTGAPDVIGVWFEQSGQVNQHETTIPFEEVTAYLMILRPSTPYGTLGWECCVEVEGDAVGLSWDLSGEGLNASVEPCFSVGLSSGALLGDQIIQLAKLTFFQPDPNAPTYFYVHPSDLASIPGVPLYVNGADVGDLIPLTPSSGNEMMPVAMVNAATTEVQAPQARTRLSSAQPNPFNPSTQLSFELAQEGSARLEIFDLQGRRIRTLVESTLPAGPHTRTWDGRDDSGRVVVSGVYFARLHSGADHAMIKLMLLK